MTPRERIEAVLAATFGGLHNVPGKVKHERQMPNTDQVFAEVSVTSDMATFDMDRLTSLVVAAHDYCVRVSIDCGGPRRLKISLWSRESREGGMSRRHPTLEQALSRYERPEPWMPEVGS